MDLTEQVLLSISQHRLPGLDLDGDFVYPAYEGYSIQNIPVSICRWLGAPEIAGKPLAMEVTGPFREGDFQRVIQIVVDALAFERFQRWMGDGTAPVWRELAQGGLVAPLTSITPSTTSAAITTFWTGRSPAEHGLTGYEMWFKEYGVVGNTITHSAMAFQNDTGGLERAGFRPEESLPFPVMGAHLAVHGIQTYALQQASIAHSGLSRTFFKDARVNRFHTAADLWVNLRYLVESISQQRLYAYVYWGEVDTLSHVYGPDDERTEAEFGQFSLAFERLFLHKLNLASRRNTLLILTADHGAVMTHPDSYYDLRNHPNLTRRLHIQPTGENRLVYMYIRPGQSEAVREYIERAWPNQFVQVDSAYAVEAGLFGTGKRHPGLLDRIGDIIVAAKGVAYLWWANKDNRIYGRHGGLHSQEMLVPFLAVRL
jgi:predicted AlkP superfamily pyrophosphatase or phosphodiesterase